MGHQVIHPPHFPKPRGYANGVIGQGRFLYIAGQIGQAIPQSYAYGWGAQNPIHQALQQQAMPQLAPYLAALPHADLRCGTVEAGTRNPHRLPGFPLASGPKTEAPRDPGRLPGGPTGLGVAKRADRFGTAL